MEQLFQDEDVKKELKKLKFFKYDVDDENSPNEYYKVKVVPTIIVISDGKLYRYTGGKTKSQILSIISKHTR